GLRSVAADGEDLRFLSDLLLQAAPFAPERPLRRRHCEAAEWFSNRAGRFLRARHDVKCCNPGGARPAHCVELDETVERQTWDWPRTGPIGRIGGRLEREDRGERNRRRTREYAPAGRWLDNHAGDMTAMTTQLLPTWPSPDVPRAARIVAEEASDSHSPPEPNQADSIHYEVGAAVRWINVTTGVKPDSEGDPYGGF